MKGVEVKVEERGRGGGVKRMEIWIGKKALLVDC